MKKDQDKTDIFLRAQLLLGKETMDRLSQRRVIIFGVGGVGSWAAEGLVRSGIKHLTIVDCDRVAASNVNRQLMATTETIGQVKVEAMRQRLLTINPDAEITALFQTFTEDTADSFHLENYDYIIDAIDSLKDKALLIRMATALPDAKFFSSMGAALKIDPTRIKVTEFWKIEGDPLARSLRKRFKNEGRYPERKFLCVFSDEPPIMTGRDTASGTNGSLVHITSIFGFTLASLVVRDAYEKPLE